MKKTGKKLEFNNKSIAFVMLFVPYNIEGIWHAYKSKCNLNRENQVILLMVTDGKKWHYLAAKKLPALFRGTASKHEGDFYCLNCLHSYRTENKKLKDVYDNHDYCYVEMPKEDNKMLKIQPCKKVYEITIYYLCWLRVFISKKELSTCHNNPEKSSTTKINKHTPSGYSLFTHCSFGATKNKLDSYRGKGCMENFCKDLKEDATKIINYERKEMIPLTDEENQSYKKQKVCLYARKCLVLIIIIIIIKNIIKSEMIVIILRNIEKLLIILVI